MSHSVLSRFLLTLLAHHRLNNVHYGLGVVTALKVAVDCCGMHRWKLGFFLLSSRTRVNNAQTVRKFNYGQDLPTVL